MVCERNRKRCGVSYRVGQLHGSQWFVLFLEGIGQNWADLQHDLHAKILCRFWKCPSAFERQYTLSGPLPTSCHWRSPWLDDINPMGNQGGKEEGVTLTFLLPFVLCKAVCVLLKKTACQRPSSGLEDHMHGKTRLACRKELVEDGDSHYKVSFVLWGSCLQITCWSLQLVPAPEK